MALLGLVLALCVGWTASPAAAQSTRSFADTTTGAINNTTPCTTPIIRTFSVTTNFIVGDVDLGIFATHTWRGDMQVTLQSPAGTRQVLVNGDPNFTDGDNFNVRLNDSGTQTVNTDDPLAAHSTAAPPPYQHNFIPNAALSAFNGQQSAGNWQLEICDLFPSADDGVFQRSDLFLTPQTNASGTGATFVVASTADSGSTTLRQAVLDANATTAEADTIAFAIPGAGPHTITLSTALPNLTDNGLLIDGSTQSGTQCRDLWAGNGHDLRINVRGSTSFTGFRMAGTNQMIRGLSITGFGDGVELLAGSNSATLHCNYIGLLPSGTSSGNASRAIVVSGASARIGGLTSGQGNVISANAFGIITLAGSTDTAIRNNFIGTDATGMFARANGNAINNFNGSSTWRDITRNLISGNNGAAAIALETDDRVTPSDGQVRIQSNIIGTNRSISVLRRNTGDGIYFDAGSITNVLIGGNSATEGNTIAGDNDGLDLRGISNATIRGNTIGLSNARGISLNNVNTIEIGGTTAGHGNSIGGNGSDGIYLSNSSTNVTILANLIQPLATIGGTIANAGDGIFLDGASNISIGNGTATGRNIISGNNGRSIQGRGTNSSITINGNYIGTDASGNVAVIGGQNLALTSRDAISFNSAGTSTNLAILNNVIGGYEGAILEAWATTVNGLTVQGNNIGVGANGSSQIVSTTAEDLIFLSGGGTYSNVLIGGTIAGQGNIIAFGSQSGIRLESGGSNLHVIGNTIRGNTRNGIYLVGNTRAAIVSNRIFGNGMIGIDLGDNGVTANDAGDGDSGANDLLNFPQIASINVVGPSQINYNLALDAPAAGNGYRIEFFANPSADPSGFGEGERYLGFVDVAHAGGTQTYIGTLTTLSPVSIGDIISTTTTRRTASGSTPWDITSEFSAVVTATGMAQLTVQVTSAVYEPPVDNPFATPGNEITLVTTVNNVGNGGTDANSVFAVVSMMAQHSFFNGTTPAFGGVVGFTTNAPSLTFTPATDLRYSNSVTAPTSLAQCTYTPAAGYDPQVRHICLNPKGSMAAGTQFSAQMRARIN